MTEYTGEQLFFYIGDSLGELLMITLNKSVVFMQLWRKSRTYVPMCTVPSKPALPLLYLSTASM
jgi:hypothetical protein